MVVKQRLQASFFLCLSSRKVCQRASCNAELSIHSGSSSGSDGSSSIHHRRLTMTHIRWNHFLRFSLGFLSFPQFSLSVLYLFLSFPQFSLGFPQFSQLQTQVSQNLDFEWPSELYEFLLTFSYKSATFWSFVGGTTSEGLAGFLVFFSFLEVFLSFPQFFISFPQVFLSFLGSRHKCPKIQILNGPRNSTNFY